MTATVSFSWWWLIWAATAVWVLVAFMRVWLIAALAGPGCIKLSDVLAAAAWPLLPVIGFFAVFWGKG